MVARYSRVLALGLMACLPARAVAQVTFTIPATAASLGTIPKANTGCGAPRDVKFSVPTSQAVAASSLAVSMTVSHTFVGDLTAELIDPLGLSFPIFWLTRFYLGSANLGGTYGFGDSAAGNWWQTAGLLGTDEVIPSGDYRTSAPGGSVTAMNPVFAGRLIGGDWTLRLRDCYITPIGSVTAATLTITGTPIASASATTGTLGGVPDGPSMSPQTPGAPRDVTFTIPPGRGLVQKVRVSATMTHPRVGDLVARLIAPTGESHLLFGYTGASDLGYGYSTPLNGTYEFRDDGAYDWWLIAAAGTTVPAGSYTPSGLGGPGGTGVVTQMNQTFAGVPSNGTWTLRLTDGAAGAAGSVSAATLTLETGTAPTTYADNFSTSYLTPIDVAAPGVLGNDTDNLGGVVTAQLVSAPGHGTLALAPSGAFTYTPAAGFAGVDTFSYRSSNSAGPGNSATVSITVATPTTVQAPTALVASSIEGSQVTLRWKAPAVGPVVTDYIIEGGVAPGQTAGAAAVGSALPIFSFGAPTGAFFVRVHSVDATGQRSGPSNEIPIFVNTAAAPSAPTALAGVVSGGTLGLSWRNTFAGGAPSAIQLNVSGSAIGSLLLPLGEAFSVSGVPAGTYTFRVRATNAVGSSLDSNPVTLTFPAGCTGAPLPPEDFLAYAVGNVVHVVWNPAASGAATTSYVVNVGGSFTASVAFTTRSIAAPAPPGAYTFSVAAVNTCGIGAATATQTVLVQ